MNHDSEESSCFCLTDLSFPKVDVVFMMSCGFVTGINLSSPASSQRVNIKCIPAAVSVASLSAAVSKQELRGCVSDLWPFRQSGVLSLLCDPV